MIQYINKEKKTYEIFQILSLFLATFLKLVDAYVIIVRDKWLWSAGTRPGQPACLLCYSAWLPACLLRGHYL